MSIDPLYYRKPTRDNWSGRNDGNESAVQRWHQRIIPVNLLQQDLTRCADGQKGFALAGFCCDEGVHRNGGRTGAKDGPGYFRAASGSLPVHFDENVSFVDLGDIICADKNMERAQNELSSLVKLALENGYQPLIIGGGHEVAYGHYNGIKAYLDPGAAIGIINFDAHFDLRKSNENGYHSGTGFLQIAEDCQREQREFRYLPVGIQQNSNTRHLFAQATTLNVNYISAEQFMPQAHTLIHSTLQEFIAGSSAIYLTVCMDVFSAAVAPGVSAAAYSGLFPDPFFFSCLQTIMESGKVIGTDIAELNPVHDTNQLTAKLAAALAFKMISY
jgi:formiminoglutamase